MKKSTRRHGKRRGGGYGFGGSILGDAGGTGAGNALWNKMGGECGAPRVGNNVEMMGGRRRKRSLRGGSSHRVAEGAGVEMMGGSSPSLIEKGAGVTGEEGGVGVASNESDVVAGRGGNQLMTAGRRRSRRKHPRRRSSRRRSRRSRRGGAYAPVEPSGGPGSDPRMALQQPRAGYTFTGDGAGGIADAVPVAPNVTYV